MSRVLKYCIFFWINIKEFVEFIKIQGAVKITILDNIQNEKTHANKSIKERFTAKCAKILDNVEGNQKNIPGVNRIPCHFQITKQTVVHCTENFRHLVQITPAKFNISLLSQPVNRPLVERGTGEREKPFPSLSLLFFSP